MKQLIRQVDLVFSFLFTHQYTPPPHSAFLVYLCSTLRGRKNHMQLSTWLFFQPRDRVKRAKPCFLHLDVEWWQTISQWWMCFNCLAILPVWESVNEEWVSGKLPRLLLNIWFSADCVREVFLVIKRSNLLHLSRLKFIMQLVRIYGLAAMEERNKLALKF